MRGLALSTWMRGSRQSPSRTTAMTGATSSKLLVAFVCLEEQLADEPFGIAFSPSRRVSRSGIDGSQSSGPRGPEIRRATGKPGYDCADSCCRAPPQVSPAGLAVRSWLFFGSPTTASGAWLTSWSAATVNSVPGPDALAESTVPIATVILPSQIYSPLRQGPIISRHLNSA
jgi:hypothetical protein